MPRIELTVTQYGGEIVKLQYANSTKEEAQRLVEMIVTFMFTPDDIKRGDEK